MEPRALVHRAPDRRAGWRRVVTVLGAAALLVGLIGLLAHYRAPRSTTPLAISAVSPYLVVGALVALVLFGIGRGLAGWVGLSLSVALIGWYVAVQGPLYVANAVPAGGHDVVVMTANLRLGQADPAAVVAAVQTHQVEVLMLEELTRHERAALGAAGLDRVLPYSLADARGAAEGTGLWSRYPLTETDMRHDFDLGFVTARVAVPGSPTPPTVVALHMSGPYPYTPGWIRDIAHLPDVLSSLPSDSPVLVGGDFNATTDVAQFRRLLHDGYADATDQAGAGYLPTYPADRSYPPVIAIDHVLTRDAVGRRAKTVRIAGSDHRALLVTVRLPG